MTGEGQLAEECAGQFLEQHGLTLITRNYRCKLGEIDLVMCAPRTLVIVEVRLRRPSRFGSAAASVSVVKQQRIIRATQHFLQQYPQYASSCCRFDIVAFDGHSAKGLMPTWIRGAFTAT